MVLWLSCPAFILFLVKKKMKITRKVARGGKTTFCVGEIEIVRERRNESESERERGQRSCEDLHITLLQD